MSIAAMCADERVEDGDRRRSGVEGSDSRHNSMKPAVARMPHFQVGLSGECRFRARDIRRRIAVEGSL